MSIFLKGLWRRVRALGNQITAGGSWATQFSNATQKNLRSFFFDGLFQSASDSIVLTYLTLFVLALGANSSDIGLMAAISSLTATLFLIPGAIIVDRIGKRKQIVLTFGGIASRICLFLLALIPFTFRDSGAIYMAIALKSQSWMDLRIFLFPLGFH